MKPNNKANDEDIKSKMESVILADSYNMTPEFFEKNKKIFEKINRSVDSIVKSYGYRDKSSSDVVNPFKLFSLALMNTLNKNSISNDKIDRPSDATLTGVRSINGIDTSDSNYGEMNIINSFQKLVSGSFSLMEEYRISVSLIPELKRVIRLIVRDIINANEITKRSLKDIYIIPKSDLDTDIEEVEKINKYIDENITEKYKIEEKLPIWLYQALISGAKPILILPYSDVIKEALALSKSDPQKFGKINIDHYTKSYEDFNNLINNNSELKFNLYERLNDKTTLYEEKGIKRNKFKYMSKEDIDEYNESCESFTSKIITDDMIDKIYNCGVEELKETYKLEKEKADNYKKEINSRGLEGVVDLSSINNTLDSFKKVIDKIENPKSEDETETEEEVKKEIEERMKIKKQIKKYLNEFVTKVDSNINVVKDDYSNIFLGKNDLFNRLKSKKNKNIDGIELNDNDIKEVSEISNLFNNEILIKELDPENVIPISIGSEHILYYLFEGDAYDGPTESKNRKTVSFANIVASSGYNNDQALVSASNGVSIIPSDPSLSSVFNPANFGNINLPIEGTDATQNIDKVNVMKEIVFKTLAYRLKDPSLVDDKTFKDAIINLIREGYIIDREIKFTAVPSSNIVYLAHDLDDKGMPHSILDGTLIHIYMYLAGIISATMDIVKKSSDKEKLEVNLGMSNQAGMTLMEIQKQLSTRNIHVRSFFDNVSSVLKNVATYARYTIPVVDGEKLYDISTVNTDSNSTIDTDFIEKRLASILSSLPCPPSITNMINEAEFSRGILNQSLEYRDSILERQNVFCKQITKLYRLLILYSDAYKNNNKNNDISNNTDYNKNDVKILLKNIDVRFSPPTYLTLTNINEAFTNAEPVIDTFAKYFFGENPETKLESFMIERFKTECVKIFVPNVDFQYMEAIANRIKEDPFNGVPDKVKLSIISKKTEPLINGEEPQSDTVY